MNRVVVLCPLTKVEGRLQSLHDEGDAVTRLKSDYITKGNI